MALPPTVTEFHYGSRARKAINHTNARFNKQTSAGRTGAHACINTNRGNGTRKKKKKPKRTKEKREKYVWRYGGGPSALFRRRLADTLTGRLSVGFLPPAARPRAVFTENQISGRPARNFGKRFPTSVAGTLADQPKNVRVQKRRFARPPPSPRYCALLEVLNSYKYGLTTGIGSF